jgi:endoglucanase
MQSTHKLTIVVSTTQYEIAGFLARNNFNSVRLPLCIKNILKDTAPQKDLINVNTNRAVNITTYMSTVQSIVEALGYRKISVLISLHTLDPKKSGGAWYSEELDVTEDQFLEAVDILTSNLCTSKYWNIVGLDLKNEPYECSWDGSDGNPSWKEGATLIGNRMLEGCPNWMAFIEGTSGSYPITINNRDGTYFDWWGGGLELAGADPVEYTLPNKVVWSPHYYNTGVNPVWYLYGGGTVMENNVIEGYIELDDETLKANVKQTMDAMFGYLVQDSEHAVVMGEYAGLYSKDAHPMKTTMRATDYTMQIMLEDNYAGSYMWSLNPESAYSYNPADTFGTFTEGLLKDDWLTPNQVFLDAVNVMDKTKDLRMFPCFPIEIEDSSSGSGSK